MAPVCSPMASRGREYGDRRMAEAAEVVVVQCVAHGAVGEGGVGQGGLVSAGEHGRLGHGALVGDVLLDDLAHGLHGAGQDHAQEVEAGLVGDADGIGRNVLVVGVDDPPCNGVGSAHGNSLRYLFIGVFQWFAGHYIRSAGVGKQREWRLSGNRQSGLKFLIFRSNPVISGYCRCWTRLTRGCDAAWDEAEIFCFPAISCHKLQFPAVEQG